MSTARTTQGGFSLVEILVATAVFVIVVTMSTGTLLAIVDANHKAQTMKAVMNNLNFAIDNIARNIRVGTKYYCGVGGESGAVTHDCDIASGSGGDQISFTSAYDLDHNTRLDDRVTYRLHGTALQMLSAETGNQFEDVTAPEVQITYFRVYVDGADPALPSDPNRAAQPTVRIVIRGQAGTTADTETEFAVQTFVTQRIPDFP